MDKLLLLEDDVSLIDGLTYSLGKQGYKVDVARTVAEASALLSDLTQYTMLLLDVTLPDGTGFEICEQIRRRSKQIPIIFLTASDEEVSIIRGLDSGGDDYMTKPFSPSELVARVKSHLRRYTSLGDIHTSVSTANVVNGKLCYNKEERVLYTDGEPVRLTATETKIVDLLMCNLGRVFPAEEIYRRVWNEDAYAAENTVMVHIRRIREKIEYNPKEPEYLKVVWGIGYKIEKK